MGVSGSKIQEDKPLQLCRERRRYVKLVVEERCSLAASHVDYIRSLQAVGFALWKFVEPDTSVDSSLYTSTSATPESNVTEKLNSHYFPSSSPLNAAEEACSLPSSPSSEGFHISRVRFMGSFSSRVQETTELPFTGIMDSSVTPPSVSRFSSEIPKTPLHDGNPPWDFFFDSSQTRLNRRKDITSDVSEVEVVPKARDGDDIHTPSSCDDSLESEDEFEEPSAETLVRSFDNVNRASGGNVIGTSLRDQNKTVSPNLSPLRASATKNLKEVAEENTVPGAADFSPKDFLWSVKEVEKLFVKAAESGQAVPRMLEASEMPFGAVLLKKERTGTSILFGACFSCGENTSNITEDPGQVSPHSSSSMNLNSISSMKGRSSGVDVNDHLLQNFCMISGSHASTLNRIYAWEWKLHDEVKASQAVRGEYDRKCRELRKIESTGLNSHKVDKTRAVVKDLYSRIQVAIHRVGCISKKIDQLRDTELHPQLEELIQGLMQMWEGMRDCHKAQCGALSSVNGTGMVLRPESHKKYAASLEDGLGLLSASLVRWMGEQRSYLEAINQWLEKCVRPPEGPQQRNRVLPPQYRRGYGAPPVYVTCRVWLEMLKAAPTDTIIDSVRALVAELGISSPHHEGKPGAEDTGPDPERWKGVDFDGLRTRLEGLVTGLSSFADTSVGMYRDLGKEIERAKAAYGQRN